jgi:hypothetical protein
MAGSSASVPIVGGDGRLSGIRIESCPLGRLQSLVVKAARASGAPDVQA